MSTSTLLILDHGEGVQLTDERPLVVDLDGALLTTNILMECFFVNVAKEPLTTLRSLLALSRGRSSFASRLSIDALDFATLPWNAELVAFLKDQHARGRKIYLTSASAPSIVEAVAGHFGWFAGFFASDGTQNLKGCVKARVLSEAFGSGKFDYVGNDAADFAVWENASRILVANASAGLRRRVQGRWPNCIVIGTRSASIADYVQAMRVHQWLKNLLILVPPLAAHQFTADTILTCVCAFFSFSLCASSVYILNDMIDLGRDRAHPSKRNRTFARGAIPLSHGVLLVAILLGLSIVLAMAIRPEFVETLAFYYGLTVAYSLYLKLQMMVDVVALACLYGLRMVAGGMAVDIELSTWLIGFSIFLFFSLALAKRCIELEARIASGSGNAMGRAYEVGDLPILEALAAASGFTSVLVFALYISSPTVEVLYRSPHRLWLICVILIYWLGRLLVLVRRGEVHDDPVVFAATDRASLICAVCTSVIFLASL